MRTTAKETERSSVDLDSNESSTGSNAQRKRRIPGACDLCKKKKIRCDSAQMPGNRCSNCVQSSLECTHREVTKTLGPAKGYVESLEARLEATEKLLKKLLPQSDLNQELENFSEPDTTPEPPSLPRNDDDDADVIADKFFKLHVDPRQGRFFGKSSGLQLIQTALSMRNEFTGKKSPFSAVLKSRRPEFWVTPSWRPSHPELKPESPGFVFPEKYLMVSLVQAYFDQVNPFLPLLHRPSFEKFVDEGLYLTDHTFGSTLLLVCALGSRYSDDPNVFTPGANSAHSAGWKYFDQVPLNRRSFVEQPTLHELQNHSLSALFLQSTETPHGCWTQLSMALCMAQDVGAHRRRPLKSPTAEDEEWKRLFWVLLSLLRLISSFSGRQCILQDEDFDVEPPVDCDDEYWDHPDPSLNFQQPPYKPSTMSFFIYYLKLMDILAYAMRHVYSIKKPNLSLGQGTRYSDQQIIVDLDSAMNSWMDSVPDHLRWNPRHKNKLFMKQSATLYSTYYHLQIFIHRPFIPSSRNPAPTTFPSLAICTNAARSCCHVLEVQSRNDMPPPTVQVTTFTAAVVLLLNVWSGKRSGIAPHPRQELEDVQKCLNLLKAWESRWCSAGRFWDILIELACAGDLSLPPQNSTMAPSHKRPRESDDTENTYPAPRQSPGEIKTNQAGPSSTDGSPGLGAPEVLNFALPMYSEELGRLPVYGQFNFLESQSRGELESLGDMCGSSLKLPGVGHQPPPQPSLGLPSDFNSGTIGSHPSNPYQDVGPHCWNFQTSSERVAGDTNPPSEMMEYLIQNNEALSDLNNLLDGDTLNMWSTAPSSFEMDQWGTYITSVNQMTHGRPPFQG